MNAKEIYKPAFARIRKMSQEDCQAWIETHGGYTTINRPEVRELTGGYASQGINAVVITAIARKARFGTQPTLGNMGV